MSVIDQQCIPPDITALIGRAEVGETSWEEVAMLEKAHFGMVTYATYVHLTTAERNRIGGMNQTTARQKLGIK